MTGAQGLKSELPAANYAHRGDERKEQKTFAFAPKPHNRTQKSAEYTAVTVNVSQASLDSPPTGPGELDWCLCCSDHQSQSTVAMVRVPRRWRALRPYVLPNRRGRRPSIGSCAQFSKGKSGGNGRHRTWIPGILSISSSSWKQPNRPDGASRGALPFGQTVSCKTKVTAASGRVALAHCRRQPPPESWRANPGGDFSRLKAIVGTMSLPL